MTKYCPEILKQFQLLLGAGYSRNACCKELLIHRDTFYEWYNKHPEFKTLVDNGVFWGQGELEKMALENMSNREFNTNLYRTHMANVYGYSDKREVKQEVNSKVTVELKEIEQIRESYLKDV